jgi:hypothetical protein
MDKSAVTFGLIALFAFSFYGWGRGARRLFHMERGGWAATAVLGMAAVVFLGGVLNIARLAYPWALATVAAAGVLLAVPDLKGISFKFDSRSTIVVLLTALIVGFTVLTQLPPRSYNFHDDYEKYFAHVVRMIETGTVYGSPLSAIGSQVLGGQAFLQGFIVAFFPISYINGFDAVFGLFMSLMLASEFAGARPAVVSTPEPIQAPPSKSRKDRRHSRQSPRAAPRPSPSWSGVLAMTMICMLSVIAINPQYVNTSALYSGSALVMALIAFVSDPRETLKSSTAPNSAAIGLLCAALIALKVSFAPFVALVLLFLAVALGVRRAFGITLCTIAFLSPWLLLHSPHYLAALHGHLGSEGPSGVGTPSHLNFFSVDRLSYGSSILSYTLLSAAIGLSVLMALWAEEKQDGKGYSPARLLAAFCAAGIAAYCILLATGPLKSGYEQSVRYYIPIAIGLAPAAFGLAARHLGASNGLGSPIARAALPIVVAVLPLLIFVPSLQNRIVRAWTTGSVLAFYWLADDPKYVEYNRQVLYGPTREKVAALLRMVPAGETVITWIGAPFYLDYARNRIIDAESAGLSNEWATVPAAHYLIWEYNGFAIESEAVLVRHTQLSGAMDRLNAARSLEFLHRMTEWAAKGTVLHDDGSFKVVRLAN